MAKVYIDEIEKCVKLVFSIVNDVTTTTKKDVQFYVDFADYNLIQAHTKSFQFLVNDTCIYPSYLMNYTRINLLQHLYHTRGNITCDFVNGDETDLRRSNIRVFHEKQRALQQNKDYEILDYFHGHYKTLGPDAFNMKNPIWLVKKGTQQMLLMFCEPDAFVQLCQEAYDRIQAFQLKKNAGKPITFYLNGNGKVCSGFRSLHLHQIILYQCGREYESEEIRQVDGNILNHSLVNLIQTTPEVKTTTTKKTNNVLQVTSEQVTSEQVTSEQTLPSSSYSSNPLNNSRSSTNTKTNKEGIKRKRQYIARELPEGLQQNMMRKYVVYYRECYNKEKALYREFFKVEGHPKFNGGKAWTTSKSNKVSWQDKLAHANKVVDDLVIDAFPTNAATDGLPPYYRIEEKMGKYQLIYDHRNEVSDVRHNMRMVLPNSYNLDVEIDKLRAKLAEKYPNAQELFIK